LHSPSSLCVVWQVRRERYIHPLPDVQGIVFSADGKRRDGGIFCPGDERVGDRLDAWSRNGLWKKGREKILRNACWPAKFGEKNEITMGS